MSGLSNILAQLVPGAAVETLLFQVPAQSKALIQEFVVCNRAGAGSSFRISISLLGAATTTKDYLYFDLPIAGNDTFSNELGLTLNASDVIRVYSSSVNLTFTLLGALT